jgi:hypothetical protein
VNSFSNKKINKNLNDPPKKKENESIYDSFSKERKSIGIG